MALTIKLDELGSEQTIGVLTNRFDRGIRRGMVKSDYDGVTFLADNLNTNQGVNDAIQFAIGEAGPYHQSADNQLPLARVTGTRYGKQRILVTLEYFRRIVGVNTPTIPNNTVARYRGSYTTTRMCRSKSVITNRLPAGPILFYEGSLTDSKSKVLYYPFQQPTVMIAKPALLSFNPFNDGVAGLLGTINLNAVSFGGASFAAKTVRFDSMAVDWIEQTTSGGTTQTIWPTEYVFTAIRGGWIEQEAVYDAGAENWVATNEEIYDAVSWDGGFPV